MLKFLYSWRFYSFGREQYQECMSYIFNNNLLSLRQGSTILAILSAVFAFFPMLVEENLLKGFIYLGVACVSFILSIVSNYIMQQVNVKNKIIYLLILFFYITIIAFGTYVSVWSNPGRTAAVYICIIICPLLLFVCPPHFNLAVTFVSFFVFIVSSYIAKDFGLWIYDVINTVIAGILGIYFSWHITQLRMGLEISATKLEEERNKYVDQSITDELTQLRNRRDFMATFQRFLSTYRASDDWLCIALADIDFFKNYNDHYGHPKGDDCLRGIGSVLNSMNSMGVYAARTGGEEFALLWFEKDASNAENIVFELTKRIRELNIFHEKSKVSQYVTMSIGIYIVRCGTHQNTDALYDLADKALYTAKGSGRNCTIVLGDGIKQYKIDHKAND